MAKREIPEINAGSMADIAFLLLIFFLVTTTMDRDKAWIRSIPKKIELENQDPPPPVEERNILAIRANSRDQLMVRDEMMSNPDEISERVLEFYQFNENKNDLTSNFPLYSRTTKSDIQAFYDDAVTQAEAVENTPDVRQDLIDFKYAQVAEWEKKLNAIKLYGKDVLPEIHSRAHIRIEVQEQTGYELFAKIQSEIEEALFELRDDASKQSFGEGYGTVITRLAADGSREDKAKFELRKILYPDRIIEVTPTN